MEVAGEFKPNDRQGYTMNQGANTMTPQAPYTAEELAQHMENDCMIVGYDDTPKMLRRQAAEIVRLRSALEFIAAHFSSDWPDRCQSNVLAARLALREEKTP